MLPDKFDGILRSPMYLQAVYNMYKGGWPKLQNVRPKFKKKKWNFPYVRFPSSDAALACNESRGTSLL